MNMHNTWGPLLVGLVLGFALNNMSKLGDILDKLEAIRFLLELGVAS